MNIHHCDECYGTTYRIGSMRLVFHFSVNRHWLADRLESLAYRLRGEKRGWDGGFSPELWAEGTAATISRMEDLTVHVQRVRDLETGAETGPASVTGS